MGKLSNYSIESDEVVLLQFSDGQNHRAQVKELPKLLGKEDLRKIQSALKLRANYINKHLPNWLKVVILIVLVGPFSGEVTKAARVVEQYVHQHILLNPPRPNAVERKELDNRAQTLTQPSGAPSSAKPFDAPSPGQANSSNQTTPKNFPHEVSGKVPELVEDLKSVNVKPLGLELKQVIQQLKPSPPTRKQP
jgi:hypothetical protein